MAATLMAFVKEEARRLGAKVERETSDRHVTVEVTAPDGKQWRCDPGTHVLTTAWLSKVKDQHSGRPEGLKDLLARMREGLDDCPEDCDCKEEV